MCMEVQVCSLLGHDVGPQEVPHLLQQHQIEQRMGADPRVVWHEALEERPVALDADGLPGTVPHAFVELALLGDALVVEPGHDHVERVHGHADEESTCQSGYKVDSDVVVKAKWNR